MATARTPFFYARPDGSEGFVNAGEEIPEGIDAGDNVRPVEGGDVAVASPRRTRKD